MAFIPFEQCVAFELLYTQHGVATEQGFTAYFPSAQTGAEIAAMCLDLNGYHLSYMDPILPTSTLYRGSRGVALDDINAPVGESILVTPNAGSGGASGLPNMNTIAVNFSTAKRGKSYHGRAYWPGIPNSVSYWSGNSIIAAYGAQIVDAWVAMLQDLFSDYSGIHVVPSRYTNGAARVTGEATPVTSYKLADLLLDTQRGRKD